MTPRLPPRYYNTPTRARFRKHRLPPELWDTWELLNALAWVNDYKFTPPTSKPEIARYLGIEVRALTDRLGKLKAWSWLEIRQDPGRENVYVPLVPSDTPDSCGEAASLIRISDEDSSGDRLAPAHANSSDSDTQAVDCPSPYSTAVVVGTDSSKSKIIVPTATTNTITGAREILSERTREERYRIAEALADLDLIDDATIAEVLSFEHVTPEYVEDWVIHRRLTSRKSGLYGDLVPVLGAGYYRMQIREKRESPYQMSASQRAEYRDEKDRDYDEWEKEQMQKVLQ